MAAAQDVGAEDSKKQKKDPPPPDGTKPVPLYNISLPTVNPLTGGFSYAPGNFITGGGKVSGVIEAIWLLPNSWKRVHVRSQQSGTLAYLVITEGGHCCEVDL